MMKLTHKGLYGVKALYELAKNYGESPVSIKEISKRHDLPVPFLEQVLHQLKVEGLVKSLRGVNGGYILSRSPEEITLGDVIRALEGPIVLCECYVDGNNSSKNKKKLHCVTADVYRKIGRKVEETFDAISLHELTQVQVDETPTGSCK